MRLRLRLRRLRTVHGTLFISGSICGAWRLAAWAALVLIYHKKSAAAQLSWSG